MAEDYSVRAVLSAYDSGFSAAMKNAASQTNALTGSVKGTLKSSALFTVGMQAASKGISVLSSHVGAAVKRVDTLNQFPKIMKQLGFSTEDANNAMDKLSAGIDGLPTSLDSIVSSAQSIALITGDLDSASDTAIALNNAFLSSGSSAYDASRGLTQYTQMLSSGKVDMQSWRTLLETMGPALNTVAKEFGYTGSQAKSQLYSALQSGEITFDEFNAKIVELNAATGGFADRAVTASAGIQTSFQNLGTAVTKGLANTINAVDQALQFIKHPKSGLTGFAAIADYTKDKINAAFSAIVATIEKVDFKGIIAAATPYWNMFTSVVSAAGKVILAVVGFLGQHAKAITACAGPVLALVVAYKGLNAIPGLISRATMSVASSVIHMAMLQSKGAKSISVAKGAVGKLSGALGKLTGAWKAAAAANRTQAATQATVNALYGANAASIYKVGSATKKTTGLTKAFTVVQKGLNLVMKANPFILVASLILGVVVALSALQASGKNVAGAITQFGDTIATKITEFAAIVPDVVAGFVEAIAVNFPMIIESGVKMLIALGKGIIQAIPTLVQSLPAIGTALWNGFIAIAKALIGAGRAILTAVKNGIQQAVPQLKAKVSAVVKRIPGWFKACLVGMINIGAGIVTGLWSGIGNKVGWLKSQISGFVGDVKSWLKKFFKIGSPSKLMAKEIGQYLPLGIAQGFDKRASAVLESAKNLANQVASVPFSMGQLQMASVGGLSADYNYGAVVEVPMYINGREFAKATSADMENELDFRTKMSNRKRGKV